MDTIHHSVLLAFRAALCLWKGMRHAGARVLLVAFCVQLIWPVSLLAGGGGPSKETAIGAAHEAPADSWVPRTQSGQEVAGAAARQGLQSIYAGVPRVVGFRPTPLLRSVLREARHRVFYPIRRLTSGSHDSPDDDSLSA